MRYALSRGVQTFCVIFGAVQAMGAAFWCLVGAGIYGSPLAGLRGLELAQVLGVLLIGPLSALPAAIVVLWRPRWGAAWLIASGLSYGALACAHILPPYGALALGTGAHILPLVLVSFPMLVVGLWLIWQSTKTSRFGAGAGHPVKPGGQQEFRGGMGSLLLFLIATLGTYVLCTVLAVNNVTGLRGAPHSDNRFIHENQDLADGVVLLLVATVVGLLTLGRKPLRLRGEAVAGTWLAVLLGSLSILIR